ncbi:RecT family recombinase [Massilia sp. TS11]|uniref:RecT family recombinase n=1 Tax=Massilia sp. TS11 TaxID=2908003 RepID=UPI0027D94AB7|nr:RecT family recombinase [Massilia sp. TS11]
MNAPDKSRSLAVVDDDSCIRTVAKSSAALVLDSASMDSMMRLADVMATGRCSVPNEYRNSPGDCLAVVMQSVQWGMNPFAVAQKTHFVQGKIGYEAQLVAAAIESSGVLTKDNFGFEWFGPWEKIIGKFDIKKGDKGEYRVPGWTLADEAGCGVRVTGTLRATGTVRTLELLLAQARTRNSSLWADDPKQQLAYLAEKRWARLYTPGVILGVYTPDELEEMPREPRDITPKGAAPTATPDHQLLADARAAASGGVAEYQKFWQETGPANRRTLAAHHEALKAQASAVDQERTIDQPAAGAVDDGLDGLLADLTAVADEGPEALMDAISRLSNATLDKLAASIPALEARAAKAGGAK